MMKFLVKQQKIEALEREVIASDQIAFVSVKFVFDGSLENAAQSGAVHPVRRNIQFGAWHRRNDLLAARLNCIPVR